ncbi:MAG TPA: PaaI family thioesterase, partial [Acidimicrobiales bacterium]|nr:PaaI family thioesterase [Acidimicrobiales bacterium]
SMTGLTRGMGTSETAGTSETSETSETAGTSKTAETAGASATPGTSQVPPNGPVPAYPGVDVGTTDRKRAVSWEDPLAGATLSLQLSGLDYLRRILEGEVPPPPIAVLLGMRIVEVEPGRAVFTLDIGEHLYNPIGSVHGGVFSTVLDSAMGCAVHSTLPAGKAYTTLELKVNLVKALTMETPQVRSEGRVISAGRRVATASAQIVAPDGTLFAHATTTCLIFDVPTPKTTE